MLIKIPLGYYREYWICQAKYKWRFCQNPPLNGYDENIETLRRCLNADFKIKDCGMRYNAIGNAS